jgi:predicted Co/Zn/Cd cation transporter (cation efflux family)
VTPEVLVLLINAAGLALAYGVVYPRLVPITMGKMVLADTILTVVLVGSVTALFWGSGTQFWLLGWYVGPAVFAIVTLLVIEWPLFSWFTKKHGIGF